MARRRQGAELLAALVTLGMIPTGCDMVDAANESTGARPANSAKAFLAFAADFLDGGDALSLLRERGAAIDETFAPNGQYRFTVNSLSAEGSELIMRRGTKTAKRMTLVPPPELRLTLADLGSQLGEPKRLPALPNQAWQYDFRTDDGSYLAVLSSDPALPTSRVTSLTAIRETRSTDVAR